jgi:hypothetical protein
MFLLRLIALYVLLAPKRILRGGSTLTPLTPTLKPSSHRTHTHTLSLSLSLKETRLVKHAYNSPFQLMQWSNTDILKPSVTSHNMEWCQVWKGLAVRLTTRKNLRIPRATHMWFLCHTQQRNDLFLKARLAVIFIPPRLPLSVECI